MKKKYYVIGIGGYGTKLAEELCQKIKDNGSSAFSLAFDTDHNEIEVNPCDYKFDLSVPEDFSSVISKLEKKKINFFTDVDSIELNYAKSTGMDRGASLWRMKAYISFVNYLSVEENKNRLDSLIEEIAFNQEIHSEIYFVGSLAGGTSSGLTLPIALYFKKSFRELNYKNYKTLFFATTPDIFTVSLGGELKTKAFANAYATLSEINTVNLIAGRRDSKKFKIGDEKMPFGILFDGASGEYSYKACAPFDDIVLFDRMASVTSIDAFRLIVGNYIYYYYLGLVNLEKNKSFEDIGIYSGYSVSELNYSLENNVNYISKYVTNKKINQEFIKVYQVFKNIDNIDDINTLKGKNISDVEKFAKSLIQSVENLKDEALDKPSLLLGRGEEFDYQNDISDDDFATGFCNKLRVYFNDLINEDEEYLEFNKKLKYSYFTKEEKNKIKFNSKGKKNELKEFTDHYKEIFNQLKTLINKLIEKYFNNLEFEKLIFKNEEILIKNYIIEDGKYLHPSLAIVKLSQIFNLICLRQKNYAILSEQEINSIIKSNKMPEKLLEIKGFSIARKGYGKLNGQRLINVFEKISEEIIAPKKLFRKNKNIFEIKNPSNDEKYLLSDFNKVLENVINAVYGIFISKISKSISDLIEKYCKLYENAIFWNKELEKNLSDLIVDENIASGFYEVRSTLQDRLEDVNDYIYEIKKRGYNEIDNRYGEITYNSAINFDADCEKNCALNYIENLYNSEKELLIDSELYKRMLEFNVLSAMCEPSVKAYSKSFLKRACNIKPYLLTGNNPKEIENRTLFVNREVADYVLSNSNNLGLRETMPERAIEELLSDMGDFETQVKIYDGISSSKAFAVAVKSAVRLDSITKINCEDDIALYKTYYQKAIKNKSEYCSEMWNPHVFLLDGKTELSNI